MDYIGLGCSSLALIVYLNALNAGFVYDDNKTIVNNHDVLGHTPISHLLYNDFWGNPVSEKASHGSYRPLCILSFRLNHLLDAVNATGFHTVDVLLHCVITALVVRLARHLMAHHYAVAFSGTLYAVHPVNTEAVTHIVGRADQMATLFYLLTLLAYLRHVRLREQGEASAWRWLVIANAVSVCALLSKETGATALLMCVAFDLMKWALGAADKGRAASITWTLIGLFGSLFVRLYWLRSSDPVGFAISDNPISKATSEMTRFLTYSYLPVFNFQLILFPKWLSFDYSMEAIKLLHSTADVRFYVAIAFYGLLSVVSLEGALFIYKQCLPVRPSPISLKRLKLMRIKVDDYNQKKKQYEQQMSHTVHETIIEELPQLSATGEGSICRICGVSSCSCPPPRNASPTPSSSSTSSASSTSSESSSSSGDSNSSYESARSKHSSSRKSKGCSSRHCDSKKSARVKGRDGRPGPGEHPPEKLTILFCVLMLVVSFLPASNLFFYVGFVVAERIIYLPNVAHCLMVGLGFSKLMDDRRNGGLRKRMPTWLAERWGFAVMSCAVLVLFTFAARTVLRNRDWRDNEALYRSALPINPPKAYGNLGSVLSADGRFAEAKIMLQTALHYRPNMAEVHFNLGILHQMSGHMEESVEYFQSAISYRQSLAVAYLNLGRSLNNLGRRDEALKVLGDCTSLSVERVMDKRQHQDARVDCLSLLASIFKEQNTLARAVAAYRTAIGLMPAWDPKVVEIHNNLGIVLAMQKRWTESERHMRRAAKVGPARPAFKALRGHETNRSSDAEELLKQAIQAAPTDAEVRHQYAKFLSTTDRHEEAIEQFLGAAGQLQPDHLQLVTDVATQLREANRNEDAIKWYKLAVQIDPTDAAVHRRLGAMYHLLLDGDAAYHHYQQALNIQPNDDESIANMKLIKIRGTPCIYQKRT